MTARIWRGKTPIEKAQSMPTSPPLRVGVDAAPPPPLCFGVPDTEEFNGFEVDLLHALSERLTRGLTFEASRWTELLDRLDAGELDLVCTAATITPERERRLLFSEPYLRTQLALICRRDRPAVNLEGFPGRVGARSATPAEAYARTYTASVSPFHFNTEVYRALEDGTVDVVVDDLPIGAWFAAQSPALCVGARLTDTDALYGLVIGREQIALKRAVDSALRSIIDEGAYATLYHNWLEPIVGQACDISGRSGRPNEPDESVKKPSRLSPDEA